MGSAGSVVYANGMRAARLHEIGGVPRVDVIDPPVGPDVIQVSAAALNPIDIAIGSGRFYGGTPDTPYVIGSEAVGTTADGRHVWSRGPAMMAEAAGAPPEWTFEIPEGVEDHLALACGIAGLTAWLAVSWRAKVTPEDTVLVLGASGTLGSTALQAAKLLGAKRVIGAARRTERVSDTADEVVDLTEGDELPAATVIVDALWGEPFGRALAAAAAGVRAVQLGQSAGAESTLQSSWLRGKTATVLGHSLFSVPPDVGEQGFRELCEHARDGRIVIVIERYGIGEIAEAWSRQASGSPGAKIVVSF
jgi:NADPH2:quinone reductase